MSLEQEVIRVASATKDALKLLVNKLGGTISDEMIDEYPTIIESLELIIPPSTDTSNALPPVTVQDDGKVLCVVDGEWVAAEMGLSLPLADEAVI